ncbi:hypothetical protein BSKO_13379 [Bryopsis sp. KO-2023]|nr:hypothetical protein BSKO_13379 [Bryopsis sp. KO-2023]
MSSYPCFTGHPVHTLVALRLFLSVSVFKRSRARRLRKYPMRSTANTHRSFLHPACISTRSRRVSTHPSKTVNRNSWRTPAKMVITNEELYSDPAKLFPGMTDRSINGIYLSNERLDVDRALENRRRKVAYCGSPGAYSELAAMELCPGCEYISSASWGSTVADLIAGDVDRAVVPVESFYTKRIRILYDVMVRHDLHIVDELFLNVSHMLLGLQESNPSDIKRIVSHPQALLQCEKYIRSKENQYQQLMELPDTAEAARQLALLRPEHTAVISSRRCAYLYNLKVLDDTIQDKENNPTRFVALAREQIVPEDIEPSKCKTSIFFALPEDDKPGALAKALEFFSENEINLIWLDSRKLYPGELTEWMEGLSFLFYVNLEGSVKEQRVQNALESLKGVAPFLRVMGSHKMHKKFLEDFP